MKNLMIAMLRGLRWVPSRASIGAMMVSASLGGFVLSGALLASPPVQNNAGTTPGGNAQIESPFPPPQTTPSQEETRKQKQTLLKYSFKKMKKNADQLSDLAKSLQKEISQSNENVLSLEIVRKAEEIEKLAKKIKNEAKGY